MPFDTNLAKLVTAPIWVPVYVLFLFLKNINVFFRFSLGCFFLFVFAIILRGVLAINGVV